MSMPKNLPVFLLNWLQMLNSISKSEDKDIFVKVLFKSSLLHGVIFFVTIFGSLYLFYLL